MLSASAGARRGRRRLFYAAGTAAAAASSCRRPRTCCRATVRSRRAAGGLGHEAAQGHELFEVPRHRGDEIGRIQQRVVVAPRAEVEIFAVVPGVYDLAEIALGTAVFLAVQEKALHAGDFRHQPLEEGGVGRDRAAQRLHRRGARRPEAETVGILRRADLKPEGRPVVPRAEGSDREPQVVLVRSAAEEPPRVAVDAREVHAQLLVGEAAGHLLVQVVRQGLEGRVERALEVLPVREEPGPLVVEGQLPEEVRRLF